MKIDQKRGVIFRFISLNGLTLLFTFVPISALFCAVLNGYWGVIFLIMLFSAPIVWVIVTGNRELIREYRVVKKLLSFNTIEQGLECLRIAENMVDKLAKADDVAYSHHMYYECVEPIQEKLSEMGWNDDRKRD